MLLEIWDNLHSPNVIVFEVHEVDFLVMRIISILCKLQHVSSYVLIKYIVTTNLNRSLCYVHVEICY